LETEQNKSYWSKNVKYRAAVEDKYFPELRNAGESARKNFWFLSLLPGMNKCNIFISCIVNIVNMAIWEIKLRKEMLPVAVFLADINNQVYKMLALSSVVRNEKLSVPRAQKKKTNALQAGPPR
jgi:hypothetical protein